jgi:hypothetical protein
MKFYEVAHEMEPGDVFRTKYDQITAVRNNGCISFKHADGKAVELYSGVLNCEGELIKEESTLVPCPCGKRPRYIIVEYFGSSTRFFVTGECCRNWYVRFETKAGDDVNKAAIKAWNEAQRGVYG